MNIAAAILKQAMKKAVAELPPDDKLPVTTSGMVRRQLAHIGKPPPNPSSNPRYNRKPEPETDYLYSVDGDMEIVRTPTEVLHKLEKYHIPNSEKASDAQMTRLRGLIHIAISRGYVKEYEAGKWGWVMRQRCTAEFATQMITHFVELNKADD